MNINVTICDDEKVFSEQLKTTIQQINKNDVSFNIEIFTSGKDIINKVQSGMTYHIVFMDIELNDNLLGTDVGMFIKLTNPDTLLIYVSSYDIYYKDLVAAEPFAFLEKPVNIDKLTTTISFALKRIHYLYFSYLYRYKSNGYINTVNLKDVMYFESKHRIIIIHLNNQTIFTFYEKLDEVQQEVERIYPFFIRVSKSFLVNINHIKKAQKSQVCLIDNTIINATYNYEKEYILKIKNYTINH